MLPESSTEDVLSMLIGALAPDAERPDQLLLARAIEESERRLMLIVPSALRALYSLALNERRVMEGANIFRSPHELVEENGILRFCDEVQGSLYWGVKGLDCRDQDSDQAVLQFNTQDKEWFPYCNSLSAFVVCMVAWQLVLTSSAKGKVLVKRKDFQKISRSMTVCACNLPDETEDLKIGFRDGIGVCYFCRDRILYVGCLNEDGLIRFEEDLGIEVDWL